MPKSILGYIGVILLCLAIVTGFSWNGALSAQKKAGIHKITHDGKYKMVYTNYNGCVVMQLDNRHIMVQADSGNVHELAQITTTKIGWSVESLSFIGKTYDRSKGPDLITRQCSKMINSIANIRISWVARATVVE